MEAAFQNEDDSDGDYDDGLLNLGEEEGLFSCLYYLIYPNITFTEDVWDSDSAYIEMLANEVKSSSRKLVYTVLTLTTGGSFAREVPEASCSWRR